MGDHFREEGGGKYRRRREVSKRTTRRPEKPQDIILSTIYLKISIIHIWL